MRNESEGHLASTVVGIVTKCAGMGSTIKIPAEDNASQVKFDTSALLFGFVSCSYPVNKILRFIDLAN